MRTRSSTICLDRAGAAASVLPAAGTPRKRFALPDARLVIHHPDRRDLPSRQATVAPPAGR
ncbi:ATP-dependent Clp protease proteolytic subunit [Streptomyces tuirus]|uniref:ATP-dependent Clp protease proteolytic subunit n=1 Tax=Streptomyces tuirus TaxID=68278 RepID=UPI00341C1B11